MKTPSIILGLLLIIAVSCTKNNEEIVATNVNQIPSDPNKTTDPETPTDDPADSPTEPILIKVGDYVVNGKACAGSGISQVSSSEIVFETETQTIFDQGTTRLACSMVLPIEIPADKILVIEKVEVISRLELNTEMKGQTQIESFFAGSSGEILIHTEENLTSTSLLSEKVLITTEVLKTGCGKAVNLRANVSSIIKGGQVQELKQAQATTGAIRFSYRLEDCLN